MNPTHVGQCNAVSSRRASTICSKEGPFQCRRLLLMPICGRAWRSLQFPRKGIARRHADTWVSGSTMVISSETHRQAIGERGLACTGSPSVSHLPSGVVGHHNGAHACTGCAVQAAAPPTNLRDWAQVHGEGVAPAAMPYSFYETTKQPAVKASWTTANRPAASTVFQPIVVQQVPCAHPSSCRLSNAIAIAMWAMGPHFP